MSDMTRREWNRMALGGIVGVSIPFSYRGYAKKINSKFNGVLIGVQSYSFRDRPLDDAIKAMADIGIGSCELWQGHVEPRVSREELRKWRLSVPLQHFKDIRAKFERAGVDLYAYNLSFRDDFTDEEIERGFEMARAMGARAMTASATVSVARRIDPFAKRYKMRVGMHNHSNLDDPNEFATPESFARAMEGASSYIAINLDIGHFTAANFDAVDYLSKHHDRMVSLHIKDRQRNQGKNVPFGEGDTPIKEVLDLMRRKKSPFPANIEYEYAGKDTVEEVRSCLEYCKQALGAGK